MDTNTENQIKWEVSLDEEGNEYFKVLPKDFAKFALSQNIVDYLRAYHPKHFDSYMAEFIPLFEKLNPEIFKKYGESTSSPPTPTK